MLLYLLSMTASSIDCGSTTPVLSSVLLLLPLEGVAHAVRPTERTVVFPFRTSNVIRSVRSSHLLSSSGISRHSSARVSARSLIGSPRCDFTFIRKVALPARTRCVSRQTISRKISASGAVAGVAFPPCPTHFLVAHKTASLSHNRRTSSLRAADCNAHTTPPQLRPV